MRIISGKHKGRLLHPPANMPARPTTDFAKTGLFNIINNRFNIDQLSILDLYAGTGAIGLEFLSRGAEKVTFIEQDRVCSKFIQDTLTKLEMKSGTLIATEVEKFLGSCNQKFDLIFADPPYAKCDPGKLLTLINNNNLLNDDGLLIIEHAKELSTLTEELGAEVRSYGGSSFSFFQY